MTANRAFKRQVRERTHRTGESYTAARHQVLAARNPTTSTTTAEVPVARLRLAVAQTTPRRGLDPESFRSAGDEICSLMRKAHAEGAELVLFCEATFCFPDKEELSADPERLADADWDRFPWHALDTEIEQVRATARVLSLWTVIGVQRRPEPGSSSTRPTTSLMVIDAAGDIAAVYDERLLSRSKLSYMYAAGTGPIVVDVHGVRIGLVSGLEVLFPTLFSNYEADGVDCVLYATAGTPNPADANSLASPALTHAQQNHIWIGYAVPSDQAPYTPAGIIDPDGGWAARCPAEATPAISITEVSTRADSPAQVWRRTMLASLHT